MFRPSGCRVQYWIWEDDGEEEGERERVGRGTGGRERREGSEKRKGEEKVFQSVNTDTLSSC